MSETPIHPWDTCTVANRHHRHGHQLVDEQGEAFDVLDCADIDLLSNLVCELAEGAQTADCPLLRVVVLSIHQFTPQGTQGEHPIDYWQDKCREWFPEF